MSGAFSHEMLTPIRCVSQLTGSLIKKFKFDKDQKDTVFELEVIQNTTQFLLNQV